MKIFVQMGEHSYLQSCP